jgi:hypothetical protein
MGGIPPASLACHAPLSLMFSNITNGGESQFSFIIALPLATGVGFITITMATTLSTATVKTATSSPLITFIPGEVRLSLVNSCLINWLRALGDAMVRIATIETCIGMMFLLNIPLFRYVQCIKHIVCLVAQLLDSVQMSRVMEGSQSVKLSQTPTNQKMTKHLFEGKN